MTSTDKGFLIPFFFHLQHILQRFPHHPSDLVAREFTAGRVHRLADPLTLDRIEVEMPRAGDKAIQMEILP